MCVKIAAVTLGVCLVGCVVLPTIGDGSSKAQVTRYLEANSNVKLAQEMHPKAVEKLVKLYEKGEIQVSDITRYGTYLGRFQDLKSLFYDAVEWTEISESAVNVGEFFILTTGNDPLQKYGRHLHALEPAERSRIDEIVWNENSTGANRRRILATYLRELGMFDNEAELQSFLDAVFVAYIHSHLWAEEKRVRLGTSRFSSRDNFRGHLRLSNSFSSFPHDEKQFVRAFEELKDNGFIEILDAWSAEAQKGIAHTRANMPLRDGEIVIIPVLTLLSSTRRGLKEKGDIQFAKILYPYFKEAVKTRDWTDFNRKMRERGHGELLWGSKHVAYIRYLSSWPIPVSRGVNR